ncbi:MAG: hypothetical protein WDW36_008357 [Sanguina aurantia]
MALSRWIAAADDDSDRVPGGAARQHQGHAAVGHRAITILPRRHLAITGLRAAVSRCRFGVRMMPLSVRSPSQTAPPTDDVGNRFAVRAEQRFLPDHGKVSGNGVGGDGAARRMMHARHRCAPRRCGRQARAAMASPGQGRIAPVISSSVHAGSLARSKRGLVRRRGVRLAAFMVHRQAGTLHFQFAQLRVGLQQTAHHGFRRRRRDVWARASTRPR